MVAPFNACKVDVAMPGNHDFDFGAVQMRKVIAKMTTNEFRPKGIRDEERLELRKMISKDKRITKETGAADLNIRKSISTQSYSKHAEPKIMEEL